MSTLKKIEQAYIQHAKDVYRYEIPCQESPEQSTLLYMEKTALYQAVHALPEPMRELVYLRLTGEFSFAEIGEILGKSESWARTTFYRAKQKIMEEMEDSK